MDKNILKSRRRKLGMPIQILSRLSGVSVVTVKRILEDPGSAESAHVAAVGRVLGLNFANARKVSVERILRKRAKMKARLVARYVQGTQGLESAAVDPEGYKRIVKVAIETLLAGDKRKLWDEE